MSVWPSSRNLIQNFRRRGDSDGRTRRRASISRFYGGPIAPGAVGVWAGLNIPSTTELNNVGSGFRPVGRGRC